MEGRGYTPLLQENYPPHHDQTAYQQYPPPKWYPPQQGYPPQDTYVPPPYYPPPQQQPYPPNTNAVPVTQQHTTNVIVIQSKPTPEATKPVTVVHRKGDHYLTLSVALTCLCCFIGHWMSLLCTVPAIFFALSALDSERQGDVNKARSKRRVALILNVVSIVWMFIAIVIIIIVASVSVSVASASANSAYYCYYYITYSTDYDYNYTNYYSYTDYTCYI